MTDTTTETRNLIARVRDGIAPTDQPQALRDLARTADGEPRVDAGMLRQEAASLEAGDDATLADYVRVAGSWGARRIAIPIDVAAVALGENDRLRARVAELEEKLAEAEQDAANVREVSAVVRAEDYEEIEQLRARVAELEEQVKEAVVRLARVPDMIDRERREGAEAMRERAVAALDRGVRLWPANSEGRGIAVAARETIRALPLDDDAREDAQGGE